MHASPKAYELIKASEGLCLTAYDCPAGVKTIGYGHTHGVKPGDVITQHQADVLLATDVAECERTISNLVTAPLTQGIYDALVDFIFNFGAAKFAGSTLLKKLNAGDYAGARRALLAWVHANGMVLDGLLKRRDAEWKLWGDEAPQPGASLNAKESSTTAADDDAEH